MPPSLWCPEDLYSARRTLSTGADLLTNKQRQRISGVFADEAIIGRLKHLRGSALRFRNFGGHTVTEHTALMTSRLVSSDGGPVLRFVWPDQTARSGSSQAGYADAGPVRMLMPVLADGARISGACEPQ